jgi:hypothetical protein
MKFTVLSPIQTVAMAIKVMGKYRRVNFSISVLFFFQFLATIYCDTDRDSVLMVAGYTGHEDGFKNTHPLTISVSEEISSRYYFTLILQYQC